MTDGRLMTDGHLMTHSPRARLARATVPAQVDVRAALPAGARAESPEGHPPAVMGRGRVSLLANSDTRRSKLVRDTGHL